MIRGQDRRLHRWLDAIQLGKLTGKPSLPPGVAPPTDIERDHVRGWHARLTGEDLDPAWLAEVMQEIKAPPLAAGAHPPLVVLTPPTSTVGRVRQWICQRENRLKHPFVTVQAWRKTVGRVKLIRNCLGMSSLTLGFGSVVWLLGWIAPKLRAWGMAVEAGVSEAGSEQAFWDTSKDAGSVAHALMVQIQNMNLSMSLITGGLLVSVLCGMLWMIFDHWVKMREIRRVSVEDLTIWGRSPHSQAYLAHRPTGMPFLHLEGLHLSHLARRDGVFNYMQVPAGTWPSDLPAAPENTEKSR